MNHGGRPVVDLLCQPGMGAGCCRCANPVALGRWWADALGWVVLNDSATEFEIRPSTDRLSGLIFVPIPEAKQSTIRLHLDFGPMTSKPRSNGSCAWLRVASIVGKAPRPGWSLRTPRATNSMCCRPEEPEPQQRIVAYPRARRTPAR